MSSIHQVYVIFIIKVPIDDRLGSGCPARWCAPTPRLSAICGKHGFIIAYQNGSVYGSTHSQLSRELVQRFIGCLLVLAILGYYTEDSRNT